MKDPTDLTIGKRTYHVEEGVDAQSVKVSGEIFGQSGRLLPRLDDKLQAALIDHGYPIGDHYSIVSHPANSPDGLHGSLTYPYAPKGWYKIFYTPFAASLKADPVVIELKRQASAIDRRFHLAEAVGLKLPSREYLTGPISELEAAFHAHAAQAWQEYADVEVTHVHLVDDHMPPSFRFDYDGHTYTLNFTIEPADRDFLTRHLAELLGRVAMLDDGTVVSKFKRSKGA